MITVMPPKPNEQMIPSPAWGTDLVDNSIHITVLYVPNSQDG